MTCLRTLNFLNKNHEILKLTVSNGILCFIKGSLQKRQRFPEKVSSFSLCDFAKKLAIELAVLKDHLYRAHMQYRAFKTKRMWAEKSSDTVTFQIDWSENASICQAQDKKSAYYHIGQISVHCSHS